MSGLKGYLKCGKELDVCSLVYMGRIWCTREKNEAERVANVWVCMKYSDGRMKGIVKSEPMHG